MKMKKVLAITLASVMTMSLAACGAEETASAPAAESAATETVAEEATEEVEATTEDTAVAGLPTYSQINLGDYTDLTATIKFLHCRTDREEDGTYAALWEKFNEMYPNITIESEGVTDFAEDSLLRLTTGDWGDIMFIPAIDKADLPTYFMPYDTVDNMKKEINFAEMWTNGDQSYGVPCLANAQGIVYNKRIFDEAGITELPKTPEEFIAALQLIKDNTDAIPLYTNYAAGWTMGAWDAYLGCVSDGDDAYFNQKFVHTANPFEDKGDGTGAYALYKILFDAVANGLIEDDYTTTDWEGCKGMINRGEIGCMVLGSWAFVQMQQGDSHPEDIGYMPFPITVNGVQYALAGGDYNYGINVNASDDNKLASMIFVKWMTEESNWCYDEGGYTVAIDGKNPDMYKAFESATLLSDLPALAGEESFLNDMNAESELSFNAGGNDKVQRIVEAAATGSETFDEIMADWAAAWQAAQEELEIEVLY